MNCQLCGEPIGDEKIGATKICGKAYSLCLRCDFDLSQDLDAMINHYAINILWCGGKISYSCWEYIRDFLRKNNITEVLEIGTGLSSELFVNEGIKLTTLDSLKPHSELYQKHLFIKDRATVLYYPDGDHLPDLGRKWDFVFVDSPQTRGPEVRYAMKMSNRWIMLHDPNMGEQDFFPNDDWKEVAFKIYEKVAK